MLTLGHGGLRLRDKELGGSKALFMDGQLMGGMDSDAKMSLLRDGYYSIKQTPGR